MILHARRVIRWIDADGYEKVVAPRAIAELGLKLREPCGYDRTRAD